MTTYIDAVYTAYFQVGGAVQQYPVRVKQDTINATTDGGVENVSSILDATEPISAIVGGSKRRIGLHCRLVRLKQAIEDSTGTTVAFTRVTIPALTPGFYAACLTPGVVITYKTTDWEVVSTRPELVV
jgi:hypothetical protein